MIELGTPYEDGAYWFVPATVREADGTVRDDPARVRFYNLDGAEHCVIAMPNL